MITAAGASQAPTPADAAGRHESDDDAAAGAPARRYSTAVEIVWASVSPAIRLLAKSLTPTENSAIWGRITIGNWCSSTPAAAPNNR